MSKKLTPWFPAEVNPVRRGVYRVDVDLRYNGRQERWAKWESGRWCLALHDYESARRTLSTSHDLYEPGKFIGWRGIAKGAA